MKFIRSIKNIKRQHGGYVASIGNYDGMHLGHQQIIARVKARAASMNLPSLIIMFEPQPLECFLQERANPRLMTLREKIVMLQHYGIDYVLCLRFNSKLANLTAAQFVQDILLNSLQIKHMVVGDDFAFGSNRVGGFEILQEYIPTEKVATVRISDTKVSSTHIRQALARGDFKTVAELLGRPYRMSGKVAHGDKLGRKLGFPTANICLPQKVLPICGVYIARVIGLKAKPLMAMAYVGNRPTVDGIRYVLEVHLLNFNRDVYGTRIQVEFIEKIRDEIKFSSLDLLKQQIERDVNKVKQHDRI